MSCLKAVSLGSLFVAFGLGLVTWWLAWSSSRFFGVVLVLDFAKTETYSSDRSASLNGSSLSTLLPKKNRHCWATVDKLYTLCTVWIHCHVTRRSYSKVHQCNQSWTVWCGWASTRTHTTTMIQPLIAKLFCTRRPRPPFQISWIRHWLQCLKLFAYSLSVVQYNTMTWFCVLTSIICYHLL